MENIQTKQIEQTTEQLSFSEASFQNEIFEKERKDFDFSNKVIAFISGEEWGKEAYFKMHTLHAEHANSPYPYPCDKGSLYFFNSIQKVESGGYDAAIIYWSKFQYTNEDVVLRIQSHRK